MAKAIALLSGGLDSTLAVLTVIRQGIEVMAIKFRTPFDCDTGIPEEASSSTYSSLAAKSGFCVELRRLDTMFIEIVKDPPHGYGKNMNPCIDCRILMLRQAKTFMDQRGADFIITGEVLGQRPMSQRRDMLYHIDKEAGVAGLVLRPLSAKLLRATLPEEKGIVDREKLFGLSGRSRKPQMALAREYGLTDYPPPAGGCLLTEPNYSFRLKDLLDHNPSPSGKDIDLLRIGRHFRFSPFCKIVVGRDEDENAKLEALSENGDFLLKVEGYGSPLTLVTGEISDDAIKTAASICARYSDAKDMAAVTVKGIYGNKSFSITVMPADSRTTSSLRLDKPKRENIKV
jgi:tRNA-uridine 2-sulfurtransferase